MNNTENEVKADQREANKATENQTEQVVKKEKKSDLGVMIGIGIVVVSLVIGSIAFFTMGGMDRIRLNRNLALANRYLEEVDYEQAIAYFEEAIKIDPKSEEAYLGLADIYIEQEEYGKAAEVLEEGLAQTDSEAIGNKLWEAKELMAEETVETAVEELAEEAVVAGKRVPYEDEMATIADASVGDIVYWGSYEQDNDLTNGTEPVEWYVLDKVDGEATLLAVYLLDCQPYHEMYEEITWENCTLRSWLNSEFYNTAFSEEEQAVIANTNVVNEDNPQFDTEGGNDTVDKVWLLSLGDIDRYFGIDRNGNMNGWYEYVVYCYGQDNRICAKPTEYANAIGVKAYSEEDAQSEMNESGCDLSYAVGSGYWWLRSPGYFSGNAACVFDNGYVSSYREFGSDGYYVNDFTGVRPAIKVIITDKGGSNDE
ncbi:MAG: DUF6273 domain-containing protein [Lachnospiraceae bacterium]